MERIKYLESLLPEDESVYEKKYAKKFERQAQYRGNGVYEWCGQFSNDTREIWLMGVLIHEGIEFEEV